MPVQPTAPASTIRHVPVSGSRRSAIECSDPLPIAAWSPPEKLRSGAGPPWSAFNRQRCVLAAAPRMPGTSRRETCPAASSVTRAAPGLQDGQRSSLPQRRKGGHNLRTPGEHVCRGVLNLGPSSTVVPATRNPVSSERHTSSPSTESPSVSYIDFLSDK